MDKLEQMRKSVTSNQNSTNWGYRTKHQPYSFSFHNPLFKNGDEQEILKEIEKVPKRKDRVVGNIFLVDVK